MNAKLTIAAALIAGLFGGVLTRYVAPPVAFAQDQAPATKSVTKEVRAQSFTLVDSSDRAVGTFTAEPTGVGLRIQIPNPAGPASGQPAPERIIGPMRIVLRDAAGREIWSAGGGARMLPLMQSAR